MKGSEALNNKNLIAVFLVYLVVFLISGSAHADTWAKIYGGDKWDSGRSIRQTSDGGYIVAGDLGNDNWILRLDASGKIEWQKSYGGDSPLSISDIRQASDGGYIAAGYSGSAAVVLKLDTGGKIEWQKSYGGASPFRAIHIQQTPDSGYILAGVSFSSANKGSDVWIAKMDAWGKVEWQKSYGGFLTDYSAGSTDYPSAIVQTVDGGYAVAGYSYNYRTNDAWVVKLDPNGNIQWRKTFGGNLIDLACSIAQTRDGGYIVAGVTSSFGAGNYDAWVMKLDPGGNIQWQKAYGGSSWDYAYSIQQTADGGYIVGGITTSFGAGNHDAWVVKLDPGGNIQWQKTYGGSSWDYADTIEQTRDGGYVVTGYSGSFGKGDTDLWVLKLDGEGNISGCVSGLIRNSSALAANANATVTIPNPTIKNAGAFTWTYNAVALDTKAIPQGVCSIDQPLIADAGPDQTVECAGTNGANLTLDGSLSSTPEGNTFTFTWTGPFGAVKGVKPAVQVPFGIYAVALRIDDGKGRTAQDTLKITVEDKAAPSMNAVFTGIYGNNGWYRSDVSVHLSSKDNCSGTKEIRYTLDSVETTVPGSAADVLINSNGARNLSYLAVDNAGNMKQGMTPEIKVDKTAPSITAKVSPAPNANGWHNTDVTVTFTCNDSVSGIASCPSPITVSTEGSGQTITGTAADNAGNTATASVTLNIDKTPPVVNISANPGFLWPPNRQMVNVAITGGASDLTSQVASIVFKVTDEYGQVEPTVTGFNTTIPLEAWRNGSDKDGRTYTITAVVTDVAGNRSTVSTVVLVPHDLGK